MTVLYVAIGVALVVLIGVVLIYNRLVSKSQMAKNGWSDIDVQLRRRADLIPQLVTTVKGYAAHERELFADITQKRTLAMTAGDDLAARGAAETALSRPVGKLIAVAEDYPDLKASENFITLQRELSETETKIEMARRFYNGAVRELNIAVQSFPANLMAGLMGFAPRAFFEMETANRAAPNVDFGEQT